MFNIDTLESRVESTRRVANYSLSMVAHQYGDLPAWGLDAALLQGADTIAAFELPARYRDPLSAFEEGEAQVKEVLRRVAAKE